MAVLPGIAFRAETPAQVALPRMDVAAFAGFAQRGPLHMPVAIEDLVGFRDLFGEPPPLAWDGETGAWQTACLGPAVVDFFAQGGKRCWIVRLAGGAATNSYPIAGLLRVEPGGYAPATTRARSAGSWSDNLLVGASLMEQALAFEPLSAAPGESLAGDFSLGRGEPLRPGDLLQLNFESDLIAYLRAETVTPAENWQHVEGAARWFRPVSEPDMPLTGELTLQGHTPLPGVTLNASSAGPPFELRPTSLPAQPGDWLTLASTAGRTWLIAEQALDELIQVRAAWREVDSGSAAELARVTRVTMALEAREDEQSRGLLRDLAYSGPQSRFWGDLPDDDSFYRLPAGQPQPAQGHPAGALRAEATQIPRFPLVGEQEPADFYIPLGLEIAPVAWRGRQPTSGSPLERDGLTPPDGVSWSEFMQQIHLDPALRWVGESALLETAFGLRYSRGAELRGLHTILPLDEVSMLALPDAAQRGWVEENYQLPAPPPAEPEPEPPEPCPGHEVFSSKEGELAEDAAVEEEPAAPAEPIEPERRWMLRSAAEYALDGAEGLLEVQRSAAEFAAARADFVTVLGLPSHYRTPEALGHRRELGRRLAGRATTSYIALVHPWLIERDSAGFLRHCGAEGVMCGMMAHRGRTRGAWVAPANQVARNAVALTPDFNADDAVDLYAEGINIFRPEARGFVLWASNTLSEEVDYEALNARRLLILLRRVALREGQAYVFQPHSPAFRRQVIVNMERLLSGLFELGAFAGKNPGEAFQVVTDETVNTRSSIKQGRFIVELRVAPSLPLAFIVVRLIETGAGAFIIQEG